MSWECLCAEYVHCFPFSGLTVDWAENKKIINVPHDVYELGCIQDVEDGLQVSMSSTSVFLNFGPEDTMSCMF